MNSSAGGKCRNLSRYMFFTRKSGVCVSAGLTTQNKSTVTNFVRTHSVDSRLQNTTASSSVVNQLSFSSEVEAKNDTRSAVCLLALPYCTFPPLTSKQSTSKFRDGWGHNCPSSKVRHARLPTHDPSKASGKKKRNASVDPPIPIPCGRLYPFKFRY